MPKLKPCPFCGSKSVRMRSHEWMKKNRSWRTAYYVWCGNCRARGPEYVANGIGMNELSRREHCSAFDRAENAWNRREGEADAD